MRSVQSPEWFTSGAAACETNWDSERLLPDPESSPSLRIHTTL